MRFGLCHWPSSAAPAVTGDASRALSGMRARVTRLNTVAPLQPAANQAEGSYHTHKERDVPPLIIGITDPDV